MRVSARRGACITAGLIACTAAGASPADGSGLQPGGPRTLWGTMDPQSTTVPLGAAARAAAGRKRATVKRFPWEKRTRSAARFAERRAGAVSFALMDEFGRIHAHNRGARYSSASLVKAMLLVAYLRKGDVRNRRLHSFELALLGPMIRVSDNDAADAVMGRVGTGGLGRLARRAGMRRFVPDEVWGGSQVTARDQAVFFGRLPRLVPRRHRSYALGLLRSITTRQRWGVPQGAPDHWSVAFKGGWFNAGGGWRVHQGALLRRGKRQLSLAVLSESSPTSGYGAATIAGVVRRLLRGYNRFDPPGSRKKKSGKTKRQGPGALDYPKRCHGSEQGVEIKCGRKATE